MFEQIGHHIEKIKRVRYGSLTLDLEPGEFRHLTPKEVNQLRKSLDTPFKPKPIKVKRKDERPERKPRIDTARFVKGRRGKPSEDAPASAPVPIARRARLVPPAAQPQAQRFEEPRQRPFVAARRSRRGSGGFARPRGPEFAREPRRDDGFAAKRPYPRKPAAEFALQLPRSVPSAPTPASRKAALTASPAAPQARRLCAASPLTASSGAAKREGGFSGAPAKRDRFTRRRLRIRQIHQAQVRQAQQASRPGQRQDRRLRRAQAFSATVPTPRSAARARVADRGFAGKPGGFSAGPQVFFQGSRQTCRRATSAPAETSNAVAISSPQAAFKRTGELSSRRAWRGIRQGFGARRTGSAPPRSGGGFKRTGDFKRPGGGATRRPSSPSAWRQCAAPAAPSRDECQ